MESIQTFLSGLDKEISLPDVFQATRLLMSKNEATVNEFEQVILASPRLAESIIRFANCDFFGFGRNADSLGEALNILGVGLIHDILLSNFCLCVFCNRPGLSVNFDDFWKQQIKQGIAAATIAKYCHIPGNNRFFSIGLVLEIGHAAMFFKAPEQTLKALQESARKNQAIDSVERAHFGFDHCQLGAEISRLWHLPVIYQQLMEHYLYPARAKPAFRKETDVAHLAYHFCSPANTGIQTNLKSLSAHDQLIVQKRVAREISQHQDEIHALLTSFDSR